MIFFSQISQLFTYPDSTLLMAKNKINHISAVCISVFTFISIFSLLVYKYPALFNLEEFSRINIVSIGIFIGNIFYMFGIFLLANRFKEYKFKKDLYFIIYFLIVSSIFVLFYALNYNFIAIFFSVVFLFLFHSNSVSNLYKRVEKVFK